MIFKKIYAASILCLFFIPFISHADITTNLVSRWDFEEGTGTTATDVTANTNNGTLTNGVTWVAGQIGNYAINLDGDNDYIEVPNHTTLNITDEITVSAWVKPELNGSYAIFAAKPVNGATHNNPYFAYSLQMRDSGGDYEPGFHIAVGGNISQAWSSIQLNYGEWNHITGVYDGSAARIYVNGIERGTDAVSGSLDTYATPFRIGDNGNFSEPSKGVIDELRIYDRGLSAGDVDELYDYNSSDVVAPVISAVASSTTTTTATITWTTNENATSTVNYGGTTSYGSASSSASLVTSHSIVLTGLTSSTLYHFQVSSTDASGNRATSTDYTFTTATPDAVPPTVSMSAPSNGASLSGTVSVIATSTDNQAVAGVQFKLDGVNLGSEDTSFPYLISWDTTTTSNTSHTLIAVARDVAGNYATSSSISVTVSNTNLDFDTPYAIPDADDGATDIALEDVNRDGLVDLIVVEGGIHNSSVEVFAWYEAPNWSKHDFVASGDMPNDKFVGDIKLGDINNDGWLDVVMAEDGHTSGGGTVFWFENPKGDSEGYWTKRTVATFVSNSYHFDEIELADMDEDGKLDIVARHLPTSDEKIRIMFQDSPTSWITRTFNTRSREGLVINDITGDGNLDIIQNGFFWAGPSDWRAGSYTEVIFDSELYGLTATDGNLNNATKVAVGDINNDGRDDLYYTIAEGDPIHMAWYAAPVDRINGTWTRTIIEDDFSNGHQAILVDIDNDGDLDAPNGLSFGDVTVFVYLNSNNGATWTKQEISASIGMYSGRSVDFDRDGDEDLFGPEFYSSSGQVYMYENLLIDGVITNYSLSATTTGTGEGTITSSPVGIDCSDDCLQIYESGTNITLTATPESGSSFIGWSGGGCSGTGTCEISISGNTSVSAQFNITADTTPPVISAVASSTTTTTATITWTTNENATSTVNYGGTTSYGSASSSASLVTSHSIVLTGLTSSTLYHFQVSSTDASGNRATSTDYTFTTATVDNTAPVLAEVTPVSTPTSDSTPSYTFSSTEAGTITYGGSCSSGTTSASSENTTIVFSTLSDGTYSDCTITVIDSSSNASIPLTVTSFVVDTPRNSSGSSRGGGGGGSKKTVVTTATTTPSITQDITTVSSYIFTRDLYAGLSGPDVVVLQKHLNTHGFVIAMSGPGSPGNESEYFGNLTQAALARFQSSVGIVPATGYFGPLTRASISASSGNIVVPVVNPVVPNTLIPVQTSIPAISSWLFLGVDHPQVRTLQQLLNQKGYTVSLTRLGSVGQETTYFGLATDSALKRFQCDTLQVCSGTPDSTGYGATGPMTREFISK